MAFFKAALRPLLRNPNPRSILAFDLSGAGAAPPPSPAPASPLIGLPPITGPLFLSFPPWKLSQSATPFYFRENEYDLGKFPSKLGLLTIGDARRYLGGIVDGKQGVARDGDREARDREGVGSGSNDERFLNLPNLISISRMVSGPFIGWMIMNGMYLSAFVGLGISGLTDWLDGFVARRMNINSVFGSYLDPLADKVLIGCVAVAMVEKELLHPGLVALVVLRDVVLVSGAVYKRASSLGWKWKSWSEFVNLDATHQEKVEPLFISKVNTVFQLLLVAGALLQPVYGTEDSQLYITYLSWLVASTTVGSFAAYGALYRKHVSAGSLQSRVK